MFGIEENNFIINLIILLVFIRKCVIRENLIERLYN